jgi:hypothetical protein
MSTNPDKQRAFMDLESMFPRTLTVKTKRQIITLVYSVMEPVHSSVANEWVFKIGCAKCPVGSPMANEKMAVQIAQGRFNSEKGACLVLWKNPPVAFDFSSTRSAKHVIMFFDYHVWQMCCKTNRGEFGTYDMIVDKQHNSDYHLVRKRLVSIRSHAPANDLSHYERNAIKLRNAFRFLFNLPEPQATSAPPSPEKSLIDKDFVTITVQNPDGEQVNHHDNSVLLHVLEKSVTKANFVPQRPHNPTCHPCKPSDPPNSENIDHFFEPVPV